MTTNKKFVSYIPLLCTVLLTGGMVGAADAFQNQEIIFPEIAAIATGALLTPKLAWRTDSLHMFAAIAVCAVLGLCTVLWMPGAVWLQRKRCPCSRSTSCAGLPCWSAHPVFTEKNRTRTAKRCPSRCHGTAPDDPDGAVLHSAFAGVPYIV